MRFYTVHLRKSVPEEAVLVRDGFCWPALLFGPFWMAYRRMWRELLVLIVVYAGIGVFGAAVSSQLAGWLNLLVALLLGFEGNALARRALARRGYEETAVIAAAGRDEAELRLARAVTAMKNSEVTLP